ncbi:MULTISPECIES: hypothetical protein [Kordiimonas]|jgi:hypothetical protein|uniref:Uncharacterized protein n=1 Tax=Kordiimonas lacus TaxID=637679 RepID=A0A1G7F1F9_9PROT|nr:MULTISPECIES: hypothetical protein [Kordiimonas]SDE69697.1 hypothetical protein SAMN04488071_3575 [Kordiimonas lacus]
MKLFGHQVYDQRALAGALALLLVGANLSIMMAFYFFPGGEAFALLQSRWWWELTFSMEILCLALMWMCHHERVFEASGWKKARAASRLIVGLAGVSVPSWVLVICAANDWFQHPPALMDLAYYAAVVFVVWVALAYVIPVTVALIARKPGFIYLGLKGKRRGGAILLSSPFLLLLLVAAIEILRGSHLHIVVWPFLTYLHGAMPYLVKAFRPAPPKAAPSLIGG